MIPISIAILGALFQAPAWSVSSIYERALVMSPAAVAAQQAVAQAQQHVSEMNAQKRMQLAFSGSASANKGTESFDPRSASFQIYQGSVALPIPNGGRIHAQVSQAEAQLKVAQASLERTRLDLAFKSSDAFFGVLRSRGAELIAEQSLDQAQRQVSDAQKRVDAGDLAPSEVLKAQVPESQAKAALARAKSAVRSAEEALDSLLHEDLATIPIVADGETTPTLDLSLEQAHQESRQHSPDVLEAEANVIAAQGAVAEAKRANDVDVTLQASQTHTSDPTTYADLTSIGLSFGLPFSDGGLSKTRVRQAVAQLNQAVAARDTAYQDVDLAVEQAFLDAQADAANLTASKETLNIAQESYEKAVQAYNAGLTTTRDVLDSGVTLAQAKNDVNDATYDLALALAKLDQLLGREPKP